MPEIDIDISIGDVQVISVPTTTVSQQIIQGKCWLAGWSFRETTGAAAASCHFTSGGNFVGAIALAQGASDTRWLGEHGVRIPQDVELVVDSGSVEGAVYVAFEKAW